MKTKLKHTNKSDIKKKIDHLEIKPEKIKMTPSKQKQPLKAELLSQLKKLEDENVLLQNFKKVLLRFFHKILPNRGSSHYPVPPQQTLFNIFDFSFFKIAFKLKLKS